MSFDLKIVNMDLQLVDGKLKTVENTEKLIQDVLKIVLTPAGSNPLATWYGSYLSSNIIGSVLPEDISQATAKEQISNALAMLKEAQDNQTQMYMNTTAEEQIAGIKSISVVRDETDYRAYNVFISIIAKNLKYVNTSFKIV
jgi:phage baseplate assembly protein W